MIVRNVDVTNIPNPSYGRHPFVSRNPVIRHDDLHLSCVDIPSPHKGPSPSLVNTLIVIIIIATA